MVNNNKSIMVEIPNQGFDPSWRVSREREANLGATPMMGFEHQQEGLQESMTSLHDSSVAIDIESLSLLTVTKNMDSTPTPRVSRTLSRKGSNRGVGERKTAAGETTTNFPTTGGTAACDKSSIVVHVAIEEKTSVLPHVATPTAVGVGGGGGGRCRRLGKRRPPWLDPRRVLLFFATVSSFGTLLLLYFTLSVRKMDDGDGR